MSNATYSALRSYLERLGFAEWQAQGSPKPRRKSSKRYSPSRYHLDLVACLNKGGEAAFKALKAESGYASALGF